MTPAALQGMLEKLKSNDPSIRMGTDKTGRKVIANSERTLYTFK